MKKTDTELPPYEEMREVLAKKTLGHKKQRGLEEWVDDLRKKAKVQINQELLSSN